MSLYDDFMKEFEGLDEKDPITKNAMMFTFEERMDEGQKLFEEYAERDDPSTQESISVPLRTMLASVFAQYRPTERIIELTNTVLCVVDCAVQLGYEKGKREAEAKQVLCGKVKEGNAELDK